MSLNGIIFGKGVVTLKTLIVYESRHGSVKKAVDFIAMKLMDPPDIMSAKEALRSNLEKYDTIIIGGSIMAGKIQKNITSFINSNIDILLQKKIALLLAAASPEKDVIQKEINDSFPEKIRNVSQYTAHIGYEFNLEKMNFMFRMMIKKMAKVEKSVSNLNYDELDNLVKAING
jgi:menaquinone-dependent protoporphyrinogen oxidase